MTLTEFLLVRIAEDEAAALLDLADGDPDMVPAVRHTLMGTSVALNAQMRRIGVVHPWGRPLNKARAARYADHPDYREEWA